MKDSINTIFNGDIDDPRPLHSNSMCRMAFAGYLSSLGKKPREIHKITGWKRSLVADKLYGHRNMMKFNPDYKNKFECLETIRLT